MPTARLPRDYRRCLHLETEVQRLLIGGWNQAACAAKGLGVPALLQPSFRPRARHWEAEFDEEAEAEHRQLLEGLLAEPASQGVERAAASA